MLSDLLRRGPSATTIALLYSAVVLLAVLIVIAGMPTARLQPQAIDYRSMAEYKEMHLQYDRVIQQREQAVKDELARLYEEATRNGNHQQKLFWMSQRAALDVRTPLWDPKTDWKKWFPRVAFPESLGGILRQYERRYFDASAALKDDYENLAADLDRRGKTETAEDLRAEAKRRWGLADLRLEPPTDELIVAEHRQVENPSPPAPLVEEPIEPVVVEPVEPIVPVVMEPVEPIVEVPIVAPPAISKTTEPAIVIEPPKKRFIDLNSFECREDDRRGRLVEAFGGSVETEAAVARALYWLATQQDGDGLWRLKGPYSDGAADENRVAATAMALLAFQGAGNTTHKGMYRKSVDRAWKALTQELDGRFKLQPLTKKHQLYAHALATIALCELVGMTKNDKEMVQGERSNYAKRAQRALDFAVRAQGPNGGWRYEPGQDGDMSVTAWCLAAFKAAQMAGLQVRPDTLKKVDGFLDTVAFKDGSLYGYLKERPNAVATPVTVSTSAAGILCRQQRGWRRETPLLAAGIKELVEEQPFDWREGTDAYACYALTQVTHHMGGATWQEWNNHMKQVLPAIQVSAAARRAKGKKPRMNAEAAEPGSWDPTHDRWGKEGGRLFVTCFCTYMLQVYYRYPPIYEGRLDECGL